MVSIETFRQIALSFPESNEEPHFENTSFRVKKKIFATLSIKNSRACLKFTEIDQSVFCSFNKEIIYPVPNKWGKMGWTNVNLNLIEEEMLTDAVSTSYATVNTKKK